MPEIPYQSEVDARTLDSSAPEVSPDAFGANIGRAMQGAGNDFMQAGANIAAIAEQRNKEKLANAVAASDFTQQELELRNKVGPDAHDYLNQVSSAYDDFVNENASKLTDDKLRQQYRIRMLEDKKGVLARSAEWQYTTQAQYSQDDANSALGTLQNRIASQPDQYDSLVSKGEAIIASRPGLPAIKKEAMSQSWRYDAAQRRFQGMISQAKTGAQFDAIAAELTNVDGKGRDWSAELQPNDFHTLVDQIGNGKKTFLEHAKTQASAALTTLEERNKNTNSLIPTEDLQDMQEKVAATQDPELQVRSARLMRDQNILRDSNRLPPAELRAQINAVNGNPGLAYPGIPPEVSSAINEASQKTGVDVGYLGGTISREYGAYLKKKPLPLDAQYKPQLVHDGLDFRNMRSDVVDAVTLAGQQLGKPLVLTKGAGSAGPVGVDVSTVGMSPQDKAKMAGALVDAGFTGVSEFDNYMRFDKRDAVPQNFGKDVDGQFWGGWTNLSPEIVKALKDKGFAAGADSSVIKRAGPQQQGIDYGLETQVKDKSGKATTSAMGIMQFTKGTWLQVIKSPGAADMAGIDISKMSDDQLLALRKDPRISIMMGGVYAMQNKKTLEGSLGRPVNTAELNMAHFMGAGGATSFLNAYKNNPNQSAADLLPGAADANPNVFYKKDGNSYTVAEVYNNIAQDFSTGTSQMMYNDNEMRKRILDNATKNLQVDPISHASSVGTHTVVPLFQDGGFDARGNTAKSIAEYYNIPYSDMKPFTVDESAYIKNQLDSGNADKQMEIMGDIQKMGPDMSKAAMKQLEEKDPVFAHAGDLYLAGQGPTAAEIIRGRKILQDNKDMKDQIGAKDSDINSWFVQATAGALFKIPPAQRQAVQDSAVAYWVAHSMTSKNQVMKQGDFQKAVQAVVGGSDKNPAIAPVNGSLTMLPQGIDAQTMEDALHHMNIQDYIRMSDNGQPPRYVDGKVINPEDIAKEVTLQAIGGGKYRLLLDDGSVLTTGNVTSSGAEAYLLKPNPQDISDIAHRPQPSPLRYFVPGGM